MQNCSTYLFYAGCHWLKKTKLAKKFSWLLLNQLLHSTITLFYNLFLLKGELKIRYKIHQQSFLLKIYIDLYCSGKCSSLNTDELERKIASYSKEVVLLKSTITNLFLQSTRLRCDSVLVGDCNLKLMRQNYFMAKQKHLFLLLSEQVYIMVFSNKNLELYNCIVTYCFCCVKKWAREQLILLALRFEGHKLESLLTHLKNVDQRLSLWNNYCKLLPVSDEKYFDNRYSYSDLKSLNINLLKTDCRNREES